MPHILNTPISRKQFVKKSLQLTGSLLTLGYLYNPLKASAPKKVYHFAFLSDTHVRAYKGEQYRGFFPYKNLETVVEQVLGSQSEFMLIDGDVARLDGQLGDYVAVKDIIDPVSGKIPVAMALGNHDDRDNFTNIFSKPEPGKQDVRKKHVLLLDFGEFNFILLDSLMFANKTPGLLGHEQRIWLHKFLKTPDKKPVFLFVHHTLGDGDSDLLDSDRFFNIILPHKKVKAVFYGHSHVYKISEREHIKLINIPAIGYNFTDSQPVGWLEAEFSTEKVLLKLHAIGGNTEEDGEVKEVRWN